jgi:peptidoglycan/LPS O-acetylase OafA/YrhL
MAQQNPARSPEPSAKVESAGRLPTLDGLRGLAVMAVMAFHVGLPGFKSGWLGVDLFFVLSGYLITSLLLKEQASTGTISLRKFWARRFLRLMPAYWLYGAGITIAILTSPPESLHVVDGWTSRTFIASIWLYFINYAPVFEFKMLWDHQTLTGHLWSLAVEEQFYFVWPIITYLAQKRSRVRVITLVMVGALAIHGIASKPSMFLLNGRGIGIALGCALAAVVSRPPSALVVRFACQRAFRYGWVALTLAILAVATHYDFFHSKDIWLERCSHYAMCVAFAGLTCLLVYGPRDGLARLIACAPLAYLGQISYGLYLYHELAQHLVWRVLLTSLPFQSVFAKYAIRLTCYAGVSLLLAGLSYHLYELRFLRLKDKFR